MPLEPFLDTQQIALMRKNGSWALPPSDWPAPDRTCCRLKFHVHLLLSPKLGFTYSSLELYLTMAQPVPRTLSLSEQYIHSQLPFLTRFLLRVRYSVYQYNFTCPQHTIYQSVRCLISLTARVTWPIAQVPTALWSYFSCQKSVRSSDVVYYLGWDRKAQYLPKCRYWEPHLY